MKLLKSKNALCSPPVAKQNLELFKEFRYNQLLSHHASQKSTNKIQVYARRMCNEVIFREIAEGQRPRSSTILPHASVTNAAIKSNVSHKKFDMRGLGQKTSQLCDHLYFQIPEE